jgi:phosphoglycerate dehydrogenase-like enzyme
MPYFPAGSVTACRRSANGACIDPTCAAALVSGQLAAAVLDVFRTEPLPTDSPLWSAPNAVITGHMAARSWPGDVVGIFLMNFRRFQQQLKLRYVIDRARGY